MQKEWGDKVPPQNATSSFMLYISSKKIFIIVIITNNWLRQNRPIRNEELTEAKIIIPILSEFYNKLNFKKIKKSQKVNWMKGEINFIIHKKKVVKYYIKK